VAIIPRRPTAGDLVPRIFPKGRSPDGKNLLLTDELLWQKLHRIRRLRCQSPLQLQNGNSERIAKLVGEMPRAPQFPSQGATLFVDLERRETTDAYTPLGVTRTLLGGRGANMYYLYRCSTSRCRRSIPTSR
jgi:hypothetical protein